MTNVCGKFEFDRLIKLSGVKRHLLKEKFFHFRFCDIYGHTEVLSANLHSKIMSNWPWNVCVWYLRSQQRTAIFFCLSDRNWFTNCLLKNSQKFMFFFLFITKILLNFCFLFLRSFSKLHKLFPHLKKEILILDFSSQQQMRSQKFIKSILIYLSLLTHFSRDNFT